MRGDVIDDRDPLAYESGDRIGICLDVDGTVYRSGSVFVETLAFLPYADGLALTAADRRRRRTALTAVADYHGGRVATAKWRGVLAGLDALRAVGADRLSESLLATLARRQAGHEARPGSQSARTPSATSEADRYGTMRETVLSAYGGLLRGKRRAHVADAVADIVDRRCAVDPRLRATLDRLARRTDIDLRLVTDAPEHVATAYARKLGVDARVVGTTYETDADGRYTGGFDRVDKGAAVARSQADREWAYLLAAGDAPVDAAMATEANVFLAVAGQSDLSPRLFGSDAVSLSDADGDLRAHLTPTRNVVRVPRDTDLATALRAVVRAVGIVPSGDS